MRRVLILAGVLALVPVAAIAHHGWSSYDSSRPLSLDGTIREAGYEHPHGYVKLDASGKTALGHSRWMS